jgi:hypothetical protein
MKSVPQVPNVPHVPLVPVPHVPFPPNPPFYSQEKTMTQDTPQGFIPKHGGYRKLISYQKAEIVYDGTVYFTNRFYYCSPYLSNFP